MGACPGNWDHWPRLLSRGPCPSAPEMGKMVGKPLSLIWTCPGQTPGAEPWEGTGETNLPAATAEATMRGGAAPLQAWWPRWGGHRCTCLWRQGAAGRLGQAMGIDAHLCLERGERTVLDPESENQCVSAKHSASWGPQALFPWPTLFLRPGQRLNFCSSGHLPQVGM